MDLRETVTEWNGYKCIEFYFEERRCLLVCPEVPCEGKKWLLKTEYFDAFPYLELAMLKRGYHFAYIANITRWMVPDDVDVKDRFAKFLNERYGLHEKCVPVGMSCGGLHAVYFAAKYPERIAALYLDAPVMNILSCPAAVGRPAYTPIPYSEFEKATGITLSQLINYRNHPIDHKHELLAANLPIALVGGDSDIVVPYDENGACLAEYYRENGGTLLEIIKPGCGHHPHGLEDPTPLIEFIENFYV